MRLWFQSDRSAVRDGWLTAQTFYRDKASITVTRPNSREKDITPVRSTSHAFSRRRLAFLNFNFFSSINNCSIPADHSTSRSEMWDPLLYFIEIHLLISGPSLFSGVPILKVVEGWKLIILYWLLVIVAVAMPWQDSWAVADLCAPASWFRVN